MIKIGDTVYQTKRGWSSVPLKVLEINDIKIQNGFTTIAVCCGTSGWGEVNGLYSGKHGCFVDSFNIKRLSKEQGNAI